MTEWSFWGSLKTTGSFACKLQGTGSKFAAVFPLADPGGPVGRALLAP